MTLTIHLPRPDSKLNPNARVHWRLFHSLKKSAKNTAGNLARAVWHGVTPPRWAKCAMRVLWIMPSKAHHPDPDNALACLKAYQDGLAEWGMVVNDRDIIPVWEGLRVHPAYVDENGVAWPKGCVRLTFSPVDLDSK